MPIDASKFGQAYLSKLGWDPSKGLGVSGDGRTSHVKVVQKLNLMGIGAGAQQGPDGIAWKQNKDYELLLARLNDVEPPERAETAIEEADDGQRRSGEKRKRNDAELNAQDANEERRRRKRERKEQKASKEEKKLRKMEKKKCQEDASDTPAEVAAAAPNSVSVVEPSPRPMACV